MSSECSVATSDCNSATSCNDPAKECCLLDPCKEDDRPPYAKTMPEDRQLALIISKEDPKSCGVDPRVVIGQIFKLIEAGRAPKLNFSECVPMATFDGHMLIVCEDEDTMNWLISVVDLICPPHTAVPFIKFFGLTPTSTVLPVTEFRESTCSIFEFLEKQNEGVVTHKWVVMKRYYLDPCTDTEHSPVQEVFENEVLEMYIDDESRELIETTCLKLKFQFWSIEFKFEC